MTLELKGARWLSLAFLCSAASSALLALQLHAVTRERDALRLRAGQAEARVEALAHAHERARLGLDGLDGGDAWGLSRRSHDRRVEAVRERILAWLARAEERLAVRDLAGAGPQLQRAREGVRWLPYPDHDLVALLQAVEDAAQRLLDCQDPSPVERARGAPPR